MGFTNQEQLRELFLSGGMGFLLGAYYDLFRVLRILLRPSAVRVFWQDCLYAASAAVLVFLFAMAVTDGVLRIYLFLGLIAGFAAYRYTVGRAVVQGLTHFLRLAHRLSRRAAAFTKRITKPVCRFACLRAKKLKNITIFAIGHENTKKFQKGLATDDENNV